MGFQNIQLVRCIIRAAGRSVSSRVAAMRPMPLAALLLFATTPMAHARPADRHTARATASSTTVSNDLATLATVRPASCASSEPLTQVDGWTAGTLQCAWQGRLQMRQWRAMPAAESACLNPPARWWSATRRRWEVTQGPVAWHGAWPSQTLMASTPSHQQVALIERTPSGAWVATEWRWTPSPREATRQWQQGRWQLLLDAVAPHTQASNPAAVAPDAAALLRAWQTTLAGRAAEIRPDGWRWESKGICLRMETAGISQAQLHLPYSREESRLEQRAAMQLRLARTYPKATWLSPFRILPANDAPPGATAPVARSGAIYDALWLDDQAVKGQLWMPEKIGGAIQRARILALLPNPGARESDPLVTRIAGVIRQELDALANSMATDRER